MISEGDNHGVASPSTWLIPCGVRPGPDPCMKAGGFEKAGARRRWQAEETKVGDHPRNRS